MPGLPLLGLIRKGCSGKQTHSTWQKKSLVDFERLPTAATIRKITKDGEHKMASPALAGVDSEEEDDDDWQEPVSPQTLEALNGVLVQAKRQVDEHADDNYDPMDGNVYRYLAFGAFLRSVGLLKQDAHASVRVIRFVGQSIIILIQIVAPPAIGSWAWSGLTWREYDFGMKVNYEQHNHMGRMNYATDVLKRILGVFFLMLFILNGMLVLWNEMKTVRKLLFLNHVFSNPGVRQGLREVKVRSNALDNEDNVASDVEGISGFWLYVGPFMNSMVVVVCSAAMLPCFIASANPKDILFDSLGLLFLFTLDDVVSDVGFLNGCWDADLYGTLYGNLWNGRYIKDGVVTQRARKIHETAETSTQDAPLVPNEVLQQWYDGHLHTCMSMIVNFNYVAELVLFVMLFGFPIFYFFSNNIVSTDDFEKAANNDLIAAHETWLSENKDKLMAMIANSRV